MAKQFAVDDPVGDCATVEHDEFSRPEWDSYWGSNSHNTAFRNRMYGFDETVDYDLPNLMVVAALITGEDDHYMTAAGNVLGTSGFSQTYEVRNEEFWMDRAIWATGVFGRDDEAFTTTLRHQNWDAVTGTTHHCSDPGEPGCLGGSEVSELPASLFHTSRPDFFADCEAWPPIGPDVPDGMSANHIPAWRRFNGLPDPVCP